MEAAPSDESPLIPQHNYKLDVHALNRRQPGEVLKVQNIFNISNAIWQCVMLKV